MANKIRRDDEIIVIAGKDKGTRGKVQKVLSDGRLIVSAVNIIKKHTKPDPQNQVAGGIVEKEAPIHASNVAIWNAETEKGDKVCFGENEDGKKIRKYKSTQAIINE